MEVHLCLSEKTIVRYNFRWPVISIDESTDNCLRNDRTIVRTITWVFPLFNKYFSHLDITLEPFFFLSLE